MCLSLSFRGSSLSTKGTWTFRCATDESNTTPTSRVDMCQCLKIEMRRQMMKNENRLRGLELVWPYLKRWRHETSCCIQLSAGRPGLKPIERSYTMSCDRARIRMQFETNMVAFKSVHVCKNAFENVMARHAVTWTSAHVTKPLKRKSRNSERSEKGNDKQTAVFSSASTRQSAFLLEPLLS